MMSRGTANLVYAILIGVLLVIAWQPLSLWLMSTFQLGGVAIGLAVALLAFVAALAVRWAREYL